MTRDFQPYLMHGLLEGCRLAKSYFFSPVLTRKAETKAERMDLSKSQKQKSVFADVLTPCGLVGLLRSVISVHLLT